MAVSDDDDDDDSDGSSDTFYDATSASLNGGSMEDLQHPPSPASLCKLNSVSVPCDISCPQPPGMYALIISYVFIITHFIIMYL